MATALLNAIFRKVGPVSPSKLVAANGAALVHTRYVQIDHPIDPINP
jgi:hypothetical protein